MAQITDELDRTKQALQDEQRKLTELHTEHVLVVQKSDQQAIQVK